MSNGVNSLLNPDKNCATITVSLQDFYALIHRIEKLERFIVEDRREALRKELGFLEDAYQLKRTYEKRTR